VRERFGNLIKWVVIGVISLLTGAACQRQEPPSAVPDGSRATNASSPPRRISFGDSFEEAFSRAKRQHQRILVYFSGEHCGWCRRMEAETHSDARVVEIASKFVCVKVNIDKRRDLQERYSVYAIPVTLVMTADGDPVDEYPGFEPPVDHAKWLGEAYQPVEIFFFPRAPGQAAGLRA
jgi:thioredoxin-like negative regulator of GroEL